MFKPKTMGVTFSGCINDLHFKSNDVGTPGGQQLTASGTQPGLQPPASTAMCTSKR